MNFVTDYRLEDYLLSTTWEKLPLQIQDRAVACSIDLFTALILGSHGRQHAAGLRLAKQLYRDGEVLVIGSKDTYSFMGAAVAMAHASNSFDIDDGHNMLRGHPGTSFVAGVLAAALAQGVSYQEYLTTLVVCYEAGIRWGLAMQHHYGYLHSTGAYGAFGTAAGVGRLFGLSREQMNNALSVADFHAPLTPVMRAVEYPSMNKDGVPFGVLVGATAVLETLAGTTGKTHLLELAQYRSYLDSLGTQWEIMNLYFKPYTCCRWAHQPIKACIDMMKAHGLVHCQIERVTVHTFDAAARLAKDVPKTTDEAQYNISYPVAAALVYGDLGYLQIREEALDDLEVLSMMQRLSFETDPEMEACFPQKRLAWIEICLHDGRTLRSDVYAAFGEHTDHIGIDWISKKLARITSPFLDEESSEGLLKILRNTEGSVQDKVHAVNDALARCKK